MQTEPGAFTEFVRSRCRARAEPSMSALILVVDDEPDVAELFRQQFRSDLRASRFAMDFAQIAPEALEQRRRGGERRAHPHPFRHQHARHERARNAAARAAGAAGRARHHDHRLWRRRDAAQGDRGAARRACSPSRSTSPSCANEIASRLEPPTGRHDRDNPRRRRRARSGGSRHTEIPPADPRRRCAFGFARDGVEALALLGATPISTWSSPTSTCRAWTA